MMHQKTTRKSSKNSSERKSGFQTHLYQKFGSQKFQAFQDVGFEVPPPKSSSPKPSVNVLRKMSSSPRSFSSSRLSQTQEKFNYEVISIKDEEKSDSEDEIMEYKETEVLNLHDKPSVSQVGLGLVQRKHSLRIESELREFENRGLIPRVAFKTNSRYCDRAIYLKNSDIPKHFCDILGPGMCADCTKARRQRENIEDTVESFPDISISPYQLCVTPENDPGKPKTPCKVYKDCDVLFRKRSTSRMSNERTTGSPARPNSSASENADLHRGFTSSPALSNFSEHSRGVGSPKSLLVPLTPDPNPRRTSIARYIDKNLGEDKAVKNRHGTKSAVSKPRSKPKLEREHSDLHPNVFHKAISARIRGGARRTSTIERRGKLSEVSYWRFLIPEPPVMEIERMNVSIYTPKGLPGIKIFDESLFDI